MNLTIPRCKSAVRTLSLESIYLRRERNVLFLLKARERENNRPVKCREVVHAEIKTRSLHGRDREIATGFSSRHFSRSVARMLVDSRAQSAGVYSSSGDINAVGKPATVLRKATPHRTNNDRA